MAMAPAPSNGASWVEAQPGSIDIPARPPSTHDHPVWYRHKAGLEAAHGDVANIISSIHLTPPPPNPSSRALNADVVKAAVRHLRFDHPAIASAHASSAPAHAVIAYAVPRAERDVDAWLSDVVFDRTDALLASGGDVGEAVDAITYELGKPGARPLFLVHYVPAASPGGQHALVFYLSHAVIDAIGAFQIMDLCVSRIADLLGGGDRGGPLPWGEETARMPPAFVDSARVPRTAPRTPEDEAMIQAVKEKLQSLPYAHKLPIPYLPRSYPPATGLITRTAPPDLLTALRTAVRAQGCTIFGVLHAAMALSCVRIRPPDDTANVTWPQLISPVDARPLACDDRYDRAQWVVRLSLGFNAYVARDLGRFVRLSSGGADESHRLAEGVWVLAKEVRGQVEEQKRHTERMAVWIDEMMATVGAATAESPGDEAGLPTKFSPILSSIGVMDKYLARSHPLASGGQLAVSSPRLSPRFYIPLGDCCLALHAFTWEGELMMAFTFPEGAMGAAHDQAGLDGIVLRFVNEFMHILAVASRS